MPEENSTPGAKVDSEIAEPPEFTEISALAHRPFSGHPSGAQNHP
jgi:hypothetical protein